jgi:hypothetical protein
MDGKTAEYYTSRVKDAAVLYNSAKTGGAGKYYASSFPAGSTVLDVGCGSGRDYKQYPALNRNKITMFTGTQIHFISTTLNELIKNSMEYLSAVVEAVKISAIQRGAGRWDG